MSDLKQIHSALHRIFHEEGNRIVFWNDPDQEFEGAFGSLVIDGVTSLRLDQMASLEAKIRLERLEPEGKFLLYAPTEEPEYEEDWLLDIRLYSRSFRADRASILLQELGLQSLHLRTHLAERRKFFDSRERTQRLKALIEPNDGVADLDRKMIAVIIRAEQAEILNFVRTIFHSWSDESEFDLEKPPVVLEQMERFDLDGPFWQMVKATFGYDEEKQNLKNLLLRLMVTDFNHHLEGEVPQTMQGLVLPKIGWSNAVVCLAQWRDSNSKGTSYDLFSAEAALTLGMEKCLSEFEIEQLAGVMTFQDVEKCVASGLMGRLQAAGETVQADEVRAIASKRQACHWANRSIPDTQYASRTALYAVYQALVSAADFLALRNQHKAGLDYPNPYEMYQAYTGELYRFDQYYRHFCEFADVAGASGWNILKSFRTEMESHYANWYLTGLALAWGKFLEPENGLLSTWKIQDPNPRHPDGIPNQYEFFQRYVQPWLDEGEMRRAYVIISDAFRYEAAQELVGELNGTYRFEASLSSQLGVLPSYTALGMASLLPHRKLGYKGAEVLVDGMPSGAGERGGILNRVGGVACKRDDFMAMKKDEGREFVKDKRVVYIYHDTVDSIGDDAKTEGKTFSAVRDAIREIATLAGYIINNLNGNYIVITADHGFLFTEAARSDLDKSRIQEKPPGIILAKKRYLIGNQLPDCDQAWHGKTSVTANVEGDMEFWIPRGSSLFHFVGGARFFHGGAMPQEIVIPVVTVRQVRGKSTQETKIRPVGVQVLGTNHRITTAQHRFQLIQTDSVSERVKAVTLRISLYDGAEQISDFQTVRFESISDNLEDRKKWVSLTLKDRQYSKKTPYRLVLQDVDTRLEQSVDVTIDRTFTDDF